MDEAERVLCSGIYMDESYDHRSFWIVIFKDNNYNALLSAHKLGIEYQNHPHKAEITRVNEKALKRPRVIPAARNITSTFSRSQLPSLLVLTEFHAFQATKME